MGMTDLWEHQKRGVELARLNGGSVFLAFEPGTGKSRTAIEILRQRMNREKRLLRILVFTPPVVVRNFRDEWLKFSKVPPGKVVALTGSATRRLKFFQESGASIYLTNYEALSMNDLFKAFEAWQPEAIIYDECHRCKSPKSKRSKLAERLANPRSTPPPDKLMLTGSPVLKDSQDLFQQFLIMDNGKTFGANFWAFQARFFRDRNAGMPSHKHFPKIEVMTLEKDGFDGQAAMSKLMEGRALHVKKSECLDLPPLVQETILVPMSPEQSRLHTEMARDLITYLDDKACVATLAMVKALRCLQISSGYIKTTDQEEVALDGVPKQEVLKELLEQITPTAKVLCWAVWVQNYAQIKAVCDSLGVKYVEIHGGVSATQKQEAIHRFNTDESVRVLIGHPASAGLGINLVVASYSIFYSRTFSLEHSIQAEARNYRAGSERHLQITRFDLVSENSIEELVLKSLQNKTEIGNSMLKHLVLQLKEQGN